LKSDKGLVTLAVTGGARFLEIAGTDNGPHARLTFAAAMGCGLAADQVAGCYRPGLENCGIIYELPPVS